MPATSIPVPGGSTTCPSCGASVSPDEAFCDTCGASLPRAGQPVSSYDAPTVYAPTPPSGVVLPGMNEGKPAESKPAAAAGSLSCPVCSFQNQAGDRFCDQCGASLDGASSGSSSSAPAAASGGLTCPSCGYPNKAGNTFCENCGVSMVAKQNPPASEPAGSQPTVMSSPPTIMGPPLEAGGDILAATMVGTLPPGDAQQPVPPTGMEPAPILQSTAEPTAIEPLPEAKAASETPAVSRPPSDASATPAPDQTDSAGGDEEERLLEETIGRERDNVAMFEQMAARYQERTPPAYVVSGLEEARRTLADAETRLAEFRDRKAAEAARAAEEAKPDPAEVARLEETIGRERDNVAMFEQMASRYQGGNTPGHITSGLEEARRALGEAETQLAALLGTSVAAAKLADPIKPVEPAPPVEQAAPVAPPAPQPASTPFEEPTAPAPSEPAPAPTAHATPEPPAPAPSGDATVFAPPDQPPGTPVALLIVEASNTQIMLAADKREFIIGREDPVSGIFPEVDLTPHGGESGGVSRQHAKLTREDGHWLLTDLESTNYTKIDGTRLQPHVPTPVKSGSKLQFGRVVLRFQLG